MRTCPLSMFYTIPYAVEERFHLMQLSEDPPTLLQPSQGTVCVCVSTVFFCVSAVSVCVSAVCFCVSTVFV